MSIGNLNKLYPPSMLSKYDVISGWNGNRDWRCWGPFTMVRNRKEINEIWKLSDLPFDELYTVHELRILDEWGRKKKFFNSSFSGLLEEGRRRYGLRLGSHLVETYWDKHDCLTLYWAYNEEDWHRVPPECGECNWKNGTLVKTAWKTKWHDKPEMEVALCHWHKGKKIYQDKSLEDKDKMQNLIDAKQWRVTYTSGYDAIGAPYVNPWPAPEGASEEEPPTEPPKAKKKRKKTKTSTATKVETA